MSQYGQGQYGQQQFGNSSGAEAATTTPSVSTPTEVTPEEDIYTQDAAFPLRFTEKGDIVLANNEVAIDDSVKLSAFVRKNGIPLVPLGAGMDELPFDPLDVPFKAFLGYRLKTAIELGVGVVKVDNNLEFTERDTKVEVAVRYINERTQEVQSSLLSVPRFRTDQ